MFMLGLTLHKKKATRHFIIGLLCGIMVLPFPVTLHAALESETPDVYRSVQGGLAPDRVIELLRQRTLTRPATIAEQYDFATALFVSQKWVEAAAAYEALARHEKKASRKAAAFFCAAQSYANAGEWRQAGYLANIVDQLQQLSSGEQNIEKEVVAARVVFWTQAGDQLELAAAKQRQKNLNLELDGVAVFEPATLVVIGVAVVGASVVAITAIQDGEIDGEEAMQLALSMLTVARTLAGAS